MAITSSWLIPIDIITWLTKLSNVVDSLKFKVWTLANLLNISLRRVGSKSIEVIDFVANAKAAQKPSIKND